MLRVCSRSSTLELQLALVRAGGGVAALPDFIEAGDPVLARARRKKIAQREVWLVFRTDLKRSAPGSNGSDQPAAVSGAKAYGCRPLTKHKIDERRWWFRLRSTIPSSSARTALAAALWTATRVTGGTITTGNATKLQWCGCYPSSSAEAAENCKTAMNVRSASSPMHHFSFRLLVVTATAAIITCAANAAEFTIVNASKTPLQHLYVSPCGAGYWGPDQFTEALPPSRFFTVSSIAPGCYDIQFVVAPWNNCVIAGASLRRNEVWKVTQWTVFGSQSGDCSHVAGYVPARRRPWTWQRASAPDMERQ